VDGQGTKWRWNIAENFNWLSRACERSGVGAEADRCESKGSGAVSRRARKPWSGSGARSGRVMKPERSGERTKLAAQISLKGDASYSDFVSLCYQLHWILEPIHDKSNLQQSIRKWWCLVKQQYLLYMSSQYGELRSTSGWDRFVSLGHPCKFQLVSRLGSVTAWHSSSGRQPNFAALNRGHHLCSAGRPSRWALAHILVADSFSCRRSSFSKQPSYYTVEFSLNIKCMCDV